MYHPLVHDQHACGRRSFLGHALTATGGAIAGIALFGSRCWADARSRLAFQARDDAFTFSTGLLKGTLRADGRSLGLTPLTYGRLGTPVAGRYGLVSHYRMLDSKHRFGTAGWDWKSTATLLDGGGVAVDWAPDEAHPFAMHAEYHWSAPGTIDVVTLITAHQDLAHFEIFLASYFSGFAESRVYVQKMPDGGGAGLMEATQTHGTWQMYPRDKGAIRIIRDGRWRRPPNPVDWKIMPRLKAPLALRRDRRSGLVGILMTPRDDCFAIATPYGAEGHRSLYLSLIGRDIRDGRQAAARVRLVIGRHIDNDQAIKLYHDYDREIGQTKMR